MKTTSGEKRPHATVIEKLIIMFNTDYLVYHKHSYAMTQIYEFAVIMIFNYMK